MISLSIASARRILCVGAHPDDIEIGCGGIVLTLAKGNPDLEVYWVVGTGPENAPTKPDEAQMRFLAGLRKTSVKIGAFRESYFPSEWPAIKEWFEEIKAAFDPDLIFTHRRDDRHQDHRVLSDLAWNTFRNHLVLEYEIPKYDGDLGQPNVFFGLDDELVRQKVRLLMENFPTQRAHHWFTEDTFLGLMRLRGVECAQTFAEAFCCRKMLLAGGAKELKGKTGGKSATS